MTVAFNDQSILIEPHDEVAVEAICLQGASVGSLSHLRYLLDEGMQEANRAGAAIQLALHATEETRNLYLQKTQDIKKMETMTLAVMENIALMTVMAPSSAPEGAALTAVNAAQEISTSEYELAASSKHILELMLTEEMGKPS